MIQYLQIFGSNIFFGGKTEKRRSLNRREKIFQWHEKLWNFCSSIYEIGMDRVRVWVRACVRVCVRAYVRVRVRVWVRVRVRVCERGRYRSGDNKREREREIGDIETDNQWDKKVGINRGETQQQQWGKIFLWTAKWEKIKKFIKSWKNVAETERKINVYFLFFCSGHLVSFASWVRTVKK